ncbi:MAG TPA: hypothetical protein VK548_12920 [Candidatus Acidoferrum sp.]|nr:hypothetical protein [Candidatus Acidoferrum sp.]
MTWADRGHLDDLTVDKLEPFLFSKHAGRDDVLELVGREQPAGRLALNYHRLSGHTTARQDGDQVVVGDRTDIFGCEAHRFRR